MEKANSPVHLITCAGSNDPYDRKTGNPGPVLRTALSLERIHEGPLNIHVVVDEKDRFIKDAESLIVQARSLLVKATVRLEKISSVDPISLNSLFPAFEEACDRIMKRVKRRDPVYVHVSSGTPAMQIVWTLLVASGRLPAIPIQSIPPEYLDKRGLGPDDPSFETVKLSPVLNRYLLQVDSLCSASLVSIQQEMEKDNFTRAIKGLREDKLIGDSRAMLEVKLEIAKVAPFNTRVILYGESGTGKELAARMIHENSSRNNKGFVALNCGAIAKELIESELFGHKRGAFTQAVEDKLGLVQKAHGGTLFLDEIGELPPDQQVKLLRVIQEKRAVRLGDTNEYEADFRLICATNKNLEKEVAKGNFREDLFYRIEVNPITLPPLRERKEDIRSLVIHFLVRFSEEFGKTFRIDDSVWPILYSYRWKGNVRELENAVETACVRAGNSGAKIFQEHLPVKITKQTGQIDISEMIPEQENLLITAQRIAVDSFRENLTPAGIQMKEMMESFKRRLILSAQEMAAGSQVEAARLLGIAPSTMHKWLHEPDPPNKPGGKKQSARMKIKA